MKASTWMSALVFSFLGLSTIAEARSWPVLSVNVHEQLNFTTAQRAKLEKAVNVFETVVNSETFRERVLTFKSKTRKNGRTVYVDGFVQSGDRTNEEILDAIYAGSENFHKETRYNPPVGNSLADYFLRIYNGKRGVVGYTNKGYRRINLNSYYFNRYSVEYITGNLIHEWMHKLGFSHDAKATARRPYSVPYGIGEIMRDLARDLE